MNKEEFTTLLEEIKQNEYKFDNVNTEELLPLLLAYIGDHDPHLRDNLIYGVFAHLLHDNILEKQQLKDIMFLLLGQEYLFFDIENDIEYSVLIRAYAQLQIAILLLVHNKESLFEDQEINEIYSKLTIYAKQETDLRGFIEGYGYLHSIAHLADSFNQLVKAKEIKDYQLRSIMDLISLKFDIDHYIYRDDEDERCVNVLETIIRQDKLDQEYLLMWIEMASNYVKPKSYPEAYNKNINIKSLLRSLYFRFIYDEQYNFLTNKIKEVIKKRVTLRG